MLQRKAPCTIILAALNIIAFFSLSFIGMTENAEFMLEHGAMYMPAVLDGEYYRLLAGMFLHFNFSHLAGNMLILVLLGRQLEWMIGSVKFAVIYILSGLAGNVVSGIYELYTGSFAVSAGASGAVSGVIGALLYIAVRNRGRVGNLSGRGIAFMVLLSLFLGFTNAEVNNLAHIGGLIAGFILSVILYRRRGSGFGGQGYGERRA